MASELSYSDANLNFNDVLTEDADGEFHIGQSYTGACAQRLRCVRCNGTSFEVGVDLHFTAIRCPACGWELCIHDG